MNKKLQNLLLTSAFALSLAACSDVVVEKAETNPTPHDMKEGEGLFSGQNGNILDVFKRPDSVQKDGTVRLGVNGYLWRSTLESIAFMPISSSDSTGGVILTDWYTNPAKPQERVKINVYILGTSLLPQNLKVSIFKQVQQGDVWVDMPSSQQTASQLEETILTNARRLKVKEQASR